MRMTRKSGLAAYAAALLLAGMPIAAIAQQPAEVPGRYDPVADAKAVVVVGHARFTVLTDRLIRIEWADDGKFEDRASFAVLNRHLPVPRFKVGRRSGGVTIRTDKLTLDYRGVGTERFGAANLTVTQRLNGRTVTWHPGDVDGANLGGTLRTLDRADGAKTEMPMEPGLVSRSGWAVVDDSERALFTSADFSFAGGDASPWPWVTRRDPGARQDWYFFGYGHDYRAALGAFRRVSGPVPLPPRWSLASWWTRYWPYTDRDFLKLADEFRRENVPLDGFAIDMDWHLSKAQLTERGYKDQSGFQLGWTGFSWNRVLFPEPETFLKQLQQRGIRINLNMHPASGVQPFEDGYADMAKAMGIDPASKRYVPFDPLNQKFARNYLDILHRPLERGGVDYFWLDWQQADRFPTPGIDSTFWINYVHFSDQQREGKRPLLFGRWGGLGNHRYPMGFSGDTIVNWESLAYQPGFTAQAANVAYAYWNHDVGGHMPGPVEPELYTRWVQWAAYSPTLRTHTAPSLYAERRIWNYPEPYRAVMRDAFHQRYALLPYIYTEARRTYDTGVAFLRPLYYEWPEEEAAYAHAGEYLFGDDLIVAPVTKPLDAATKIAGQTLWVPPGEWIEQGSGRHFTGPRAVELGVRLGDTPMLVRAGAITPMAPPMLNSSERPLDPLLVRVQPMRDGMRSSYRLYEDDSTGESYQRDGGAWTDLAAERNGAELVVRIAPMVGQYAGMPAARAYQIRLPGDWPPARVTVNGVALDRAADGAVGWSYDGDRLETIVTTDKADVRTGVEIRVVRDPALAARQWKLDGVPGLIARMIDAQHVVTDQFPIGHPPDVLSDAAQTGTRMTYHPDRAEKEIDHLLAITGTVRSAVATMQEQAPAKIDAAVTRMIPEKGSPAYQARAEEYRARLAESLAVLDDAAMLVPVKPSRRR